MSSNTKDNHQSLSTLDILERIVAESCDCKLREKCLDKTSPDCLKHRNLYAEALINHTVTKLS